MTERGTPAAGHYRSIAESRVALTDHADQARHGSTLIRSVTDERESTRIKQTKSVLIGVNP
jgi:hypothetical protein